MSFRSLSFRVAAEENCMTLPPGCESLLGAAGE
jgi:hypothetical protein